MAPGETWIPQFFIYCLTLIVPFLSVVLILWGVRRLFVRRRLVKKLGGIALILVGTLGIIITVQYVLPVASDGLAYINLMQRPATPGPGSGQ